jgi:hypothetical protein
VLVPLFYLIFVLSAASCFFRGSLDNVPQGALIVTLIDPETEFVTWISIATAELKGLEPEMAKKRRVNSMTH